MGVVVGAFAMHEAPWEQNNDLAVDSLRIEQTAELCLVEVRDRGMAYDSASSCRALSDLASRYIEAGGGKPDTPARYEVRFANAQRMAWVARATSASCGKEPMRIW